MDYIEYTFDVSPLQPGTDMLIAQLGQAGFESFVETETGVQAYIPKKDWDATLLKDVSVLELPGFEISYRHKEIAQTNWNEVWEKSFEPIVVDGICSVRAPFHPAPDVAFDIVIEPKMSFGTGHHETTHLMMRHILHNEWMDKKVLDMGCGTAVLAILAEKKGARPIDAIDIDNWCYRNAQENAARNHCQHITVYEGGAEQLRGKHYDSVLANINRNILLQDLAAYAACLHPNGELYLSGFYVEDLPILTESCRENGLRFVEKFERNRWIAAKFVKD